MIGVGERVRRWMRGGHLIGRPPVARLAALASLVVLAACGDATGPRGPSPSDPAAGAFSALAINTQPLPFVVLSETGFRLELTASTLALQLDGQFVLAQTTAETVAGFTSTYQDTVRGTWTQAVGNITMRATDGTTTNAIWDGRDIVVPIDTDGQTLRTVYRKR